MLAQVARANHDVLSRLRLSGKRAVPSALRDNPSLLRLAMLGGSDPEIAWPILDAFLDELTLPSSSLPGDDGKADAQQRPPVLFAADGIAHFMRLSHYRDPAFNLIHAHDLALVQRFVAFLTGAQPLPNGGAVLAATSMSNVPAAPSFAHLMRQREGMLAAAAAAAAADPTLGGRDPAAAAALAAATAPYVPPPLGPFVPLDARVVDAVGSVEVMRLPGLTRRETRALLEYYAASGLLRETVDESKVSEKWTVAGGGIVGEIERAALTPKL
jgi:small subunit ribosomal protein S29